MSDSCPEQRPLLCDDFSDEDFRIRSFNCQRRNLPSVCSGRVRNHAKGAVAVITRWPDNWSTSVTYWWLGVIMIAITIFVIYNSVLIFGMIPTSNIKQPKYRNFNTGIKPKANLPDVYMHIIVNNNSDVNLNRYLPHVDSISKTYPSFKYTFLVVLNDSSENVHDFNDNNHINEIALKSLWTDENFNRQLTRKNSVSIKYISLTTYLNDSPIKKFWRHLPPHLIEFLVRSISIWERGGIAFNPIILTPKSPNRNYIEKLHDIFYQYVNSSSSFDKFGATTKFYSGASKTRPNNIQDVINELYKEDNNISEITLNVEETNKIAFAANTESILQTKRKRNNKINSFITDSHPEEINASHGRENEHLNTVSNTTNDTYETNNIIPLFLKYLFHNNAKVELSTNSLDLKDLNISKYNEVPHDNMVNSKENNITTIEKALNSDRPDGSNETIILSENLNKSKLEENFVILKTKDIDNVPELSIDIKGNIVASKTACHAFLGTVFSNVIHHAEAKTLTDFIISELSLFCNGLLSSCAGINVILT